ncbi:MAG: hypothetical protein KC636_38370, partial [Myxococcales bacterium]|nr:hypothetical protein [Myxococcales bacterium]
MALTLALVVAPGDAQAGGTRTFHVADFDDFDSGEVEGAAIEQSGKVTVGFTAFRSGIEATSVFSCATVKGGDIYVGTADPAAIWRVGEAKPKKRAKPSKLAAGDKPSKKGEDDDAKKPDELAKVKIADLPGVVVSALVELPGGDLLAATLPGGVIHRV